MQSPPGVSLWWEFRGPGLSPHASTPHLGWVCYSFSRSLREVFLRVLQDSPLLKNQLFQLPTRSVMRGHILKSATWVKKLQNSLLKIMLYQFSGAWLYLAAFAIFRSYLWYLSLFYWWCFAVCNGKKAGLRKWENSSPLTRNLYQWFKCFERSFD